MNNLHNLKLTTMSDPTMMQSGLGMGNQVSISPIFYEQFFDMKVFCAVFMCSQFGFVILWQKDFCAKAAHIMLVKLTPVWSATQPSTAGSAPGVKVIELVTSAQDRLSRPGNTKGESITVPLTSCLTGLESAV
jgi:hypothetical protein